MEEMSTLCITICRINKRNHRQHDRDHGKTQEYFKGIFSCADIKEKKKMKFLLKQYNSKYSTSLKYIL